MMAREPESKQFAQDLIRAAAYRFLRFQETTCILGLEVFQVALFLCQLFEYQRRAVRGVTCVHEHHNLVALLNHVRRFVVADLVHYLELHETTKR